MTTREFVPDDQLPDIRPGDVVRLQHGQLRFAVESVRRYDNYSSASLRPVEPLTATGRLRPKESRRTDQVVLLERPDDSQPLTEIPWDERELGRQLDMLLREDEREQQDARRAAARLARLEASGVEIVDRPTRVDADGEQTCACLLQWRNGPILITRLSVDKTMRGSKLLRVVRKAEDWLDDLAAGTASYSDWDTTGKGAPTRGIAWGTSKGLR